MYTFWIINERESGIVSYYSEIGHGVWHVNANIKIHEI